jgi:hypothetical protein
MNVVTPVGLANYAFLFTPQKSKKAEDKDKPPKYSLQLIWGKDNPKLAKLKQAIETVATEKFGSKAKALLASGQIKNPLKDGDLRDDDKDDSGLYAGKVYLQAYNVKKPGIVDSDGETPITDNSDVYSGCQARMQVRIFAYENSGNKGVSCMLMNVQKIADGERLDGFMSASQAFADTDD